MLYDRRRGLIMCERAGRRGLIMSNPVCMATQLTDGFVTIAYAMLGAIGLVYLIVVILVCLLVVPMVILILFALPLAVFGGFVSLAVTGRALDLSEIIGLLMQRGIVVTNATVLLDLTQHGIEASADVRTALIQGGRTRVSPILLRGRVGTWRLARVDGPVAADHVGDADRGHGLGEQAPRFVHVSFT